MPLPSSGTIKLSDIKTEFSGPNTLSSYLRNGTYVKNIPPNSSVPTSLPLRLTNLYGATKVLDTQTVYYGASITLSNTTYYGYYPTVTLGGTITDGTSNAFSNATILTLFWSSNSVSGEYYLQISFAGNIAADSTKYLYPANGIGNAKQFSSTYRTYNGTNTFFVWDTAFNQNPMPSPGTNYIWYFY